MRTKIAVFLWVALFLLTEQLFGFTFKEQHEQMLYPTVRVRAGDVGGSGTIVWSGPDDAGKMHTLVLTNYHVIGGAISIREAWDSGLGKKIDKEYRNVVTVEMFKYNNYSHNVGSLGIQADVIAYDAREDIALLELRDREKQYKYVARLYPRDALDKIHVYDEVWAVGAGLGHPPLSTKGILNYLDDEIDNHNYWLSSAQTIYGNSGGAVYRYSEERGHFEYIGIPARIAIKSGFFGSDAITHMGFLIPIDRLLDFLERNKYRFVYDSNVSYDSETQLRRTEQERRNRLREFYEVRESVD